MKVFISSPSDEVLTQLAARSPGLKLNILLTMARLPHSVGDFLNRHSNVIGCVVLDCGAFSLVNSNLGLTPSQLFERFAIYAANEGHRYEMLFSFDDAFGPDGFEHNHTRLQELEARGIPVAPVVHNLKNHEVETYIARGHSHIAIGQSRGRTDPANLFPNVFKMHAAGVKVHLFGITEFELISGCPAWSCDSKSWIDDAKTGVVRFWNPLKHGLNKTDVLYFPDFQGRLKNGAVDYRKYSHLDVFKEFLRTSLGITLSEFIGTRAVLFRQLAGIHYYKTLEDEANRLHRANPLFR